MFCSTISVRTISNLMNPYFWLVTTVQAINYKKLSYRRETARQLPS